MSITKLIEDQTRLFADLDKRFAEKITPQTYEARIKGVTEAQETRVAERIRALERQKATTIQRFDAAIAAEKTALEEIRSHRVTLTPGQDDGGVGRGGGRTRGAAAAGTAAPSSGKGGAPRGKGRAGPKPK